MVLCFYSEYKRFFKKLNWPPDNFSVWPLSKKRKIYLQYLRNFEIKRYLHPPDGYTCWFFCLLKNGRKLLAPSFCSPNQYTWTKWQKLRLSANTCHIAWCIFPLMVWTVVKCSCSECKTLCGHSWLVAWTVLHSLPSSVFNQVITWIPAGVPLTSRTALFSALCPSIKAKSSLKQSVLAAIFQFAVANKIWIFQGKQSLLNT